MVQTYKRVTCNVREECSKREGKGEVGKVDEDKGSQALEAERIKNVAPVDCVAAKKIINKTTKWPVGMYEYVDKLYMKKVSHSYKHKLKLLQMLNTNKRLTS